MKLFVGAAALSAVALSHSPSEAQNAHEIPPFAKASPASLVPIADGLAPRPAPRLAAAEASRLSNLNSIALAGNRTPAPSEEGGSRLLGTCACSGAPSEGEPGPGIPIDTFNGGCNSAPEVYSSIALGGSVCGTSASDDTLRDTDWYRFTLLETTTVAWTVRAEFEVQVALLVDHQCPNPGIYFLGFGPACTDVVATALLPPGDYIAFVGAYEQGVDRGTGDSYRATLERVVTAPCVYDDGVPESAMGLGYFGGGEQLYLHKEGGIGELAEVSSISMVWGVAAFPGTSVPDGTLATIRIFEDPDQDGIPDDLVQLESKDFFTAGADTDTFQTVDFDVPVPTSGVYFVGVSIISADDQWPLGADSSNPSYNRAWGVFEWASSGRGIDYSNLANNDMFGDNRTLGYNSVYTLRAHCQPRSGITATCAPGVDGAAACPCGNPQVPAGSTKGCDNFAGGGTGGASLAGSGSPIVSGDTVAMDLSSGVGSSVTVLFQGTASESSVRSGAGVRCVGGTIVRIYAGNQVGGAIAFPNNGVPFAQQSATKGFTIQAPRTLHYYAAYRNSAANGQPGCPGLDFGFNTTNAVSVTWTP